MNASGTTEVCMDVCRADQPVFVATFSAGARPRQLYWEGCCCPSAYALCLPSTPKGFKNQAKCAMAHHTSKQEPRTCNTCFCLDKQVVSLMSWVMQAREAGVWRTCATVPARAMVPSSVNSASAKIAGDATGIPSGYTAADSAACTAACPCAATASKCAWLSLKSFKMPVLLQAPAGQGGSEYVFDSHTRAHVHDCVAQNIRHVQLRTHLPCLTHQAPIRCRRAAEV